jgi:hypothetical protein
MFWVVPSPLSREYSGSTSRGLHRRRSYSHRSITGDRGSAIGHNVEGIANGEFFKTIRNIDQEMPGNAGSFPASLDL